LPFCLSLATGLSSDFECGAISDCGPKTQDLYAPGSVPTWASHIAMHFVIAPDIGMRGDN
jgi:hypothetical protein